jgi:hypothetical protein
VEWLAEQVAALGSDALVKGTRFVRTTTDAAGNRTTVAEAGAARHELLALFLDERRHLRALCRDALRNELFGDDDSGEPSALDELAARRAAERKGTA